MVSKERQFFQIRLRIRDKDNKIKELNKKENLEIVWENNKGILNPSELKTFTDEYGKHSYRKSKGEVIEFEREGKKYKILVKINEIKKGWFKDEITELGEISPIPGSDFIIEDYEEKKNESSGERTFNEKNPN